MSGETLRAGTGVRPRLAGFGRRNAWMLGVYALLVSLSVYWALLSPRFDSFSVITVAVATVPLAFAAVAQSIVVISGGIDLSVGSLMSLINVLSAKYMLNHGFGTALLLSAGMLLVGAAAGTVTGLLITKLRIPDVVATLGMLFVWGGVAEFVLPQPGGGAPEQFSNLATDSFLSPWIPLGIVILVAMTLIFWAPIRKRRPGLALYAIGSQRRAAFLMGVNVTRTRVFAYALGGLFAALGGLALTSIGSSGSSTGGAYYLLESIGAAVLGGVSLAGGRGGLAGPIGAAFVLTIFQSVLLLVGVNGEAAQIYEGALIIAVVLMGGALTRLSER